VVYKSLKEIYSQGVIFKKVPPLPRQSVLVEQDIQPAAVQISLEPWPADVQKIDFYEKRATGAKEGAGNGESRVAALFEKQEPNESYEDYTHRLKSYTSGQNKAYDVQLPNGRKFEVKEVPLRGEVRIAKTGARAEAQIAQTVIQLMTFLVDYYRTMDKSGQENLDNFLKQKLVEKKIKPADGWTLEKFCNDIISHPKNIGKQFLHLPSLKRFLKGDRKDIALMTLTQLEAYLEEFCLKSETEDVTAVNTPNARINDNVDKLFKLLSDLYLPAAQGEDATKHGKELENRAENIDRELTAFKCALAPGECRTSNWFCAAWNKIKASNIIQNIRGLLAGPNSLVTTLFPNDVEALYIVTKDGFERVPKDQLASYVYISNLAGQGVKIARLSDKADVDGAEKSEEEENEDL
jgi:hypothetical protein